MRKKTTSELGVYLREIRDKHNETLEDMCKKLMISKNYLSLIELGKRPMQPGLAETLLNVYDNIDSEKLIRLMRQSAFSITISMRAVKENRRIQLRQAIDNVVKLSKKLNDEEFDSLMKNIEKIIQQ